MNKKCVSLSQLQETVKEAVEGSIPEQVWVRAEIASLSVARGGHCYMELSESRDGKVVSQMRAVIWASVYRRLASYFESVAGSSLAAGQQVLMCVAVQYSPLYGLSLIVSDIDPEYTLGDAERRRAETLERLRKEGLTLLQREIDMVPLPCRLAVISAETAAGYRDFLRHLHENEYGYAFYTRLFSSPMQGAETAAGVAAALEEIRSCGESFDAVLVLRGGGGKLDLACFDEYELCRAIALCKLPVLTAIGHDQDVHLCDMVAYDSVKTPTALADWFIDVFASFEARLDNLALRLKNAGRTRLTLMEACLTRLEARLDAADPANLLRKGFVMVLGPDGRPLRKVAGALAGEMLQVRLADGRIDCEIKKVVYEGKQ